jgi:O-methyltransferase domain
MAIRAAATLRIADHLDAGRRTAPALAAAVGADADALERLLRHLVTVGVVDRDASGRYSLAGAGADLRDERLRARLDLEGAVGRAELSFAQLLHSIRTGEPAFPAQFGRSFWDDLAADPARVAAFDAQMGTDVTAWAPSVLAAYAWGSVRHLVDVGGGNGALLIALLTAHPSLRGSVVELPETAASAAANFLAAGVSDRADAVAGSFFEPLPPGADAYLLTAVLHNWDDEAARCILRRCAEAAGTTGRVFVIEKIGVDGASPSTEMDLRMLAYFGGRERSVDGLTALAVAADLEVAAVHRAGPISILELRSR